jgi:hypothetical protein
MSEPVNLVALRDARERTKQLLSQRYAEDVIDQGELERRLERAENAETLQQIEEISRDLVAPETPGRALARRAPEALVETVEAPSTRRRLAVFSEVKQSGSWLPAGVNQAIAVFGTNCLDFREARLAPGVTTVEASAVFGEVTIIVPPGMPVEIEVTPILGSVDQDDALGARPLDPDAPSLRVRGTAVFGSVEVRERAAGESARDARKRRKQERKQLQAKRRP